MKKKWLGIMLSAVMVLGMQMTVYGAEKIDKVSINLEYGDGSSPEAGDYIGEIKVAASDNSKYVVDYAEYVTDSEMWTVGDRPLVKVYLNAKEGYYFSSTGKSYIKLSGCGATYKSSKRYDDNTSMELEVYLKRIGGTLTGTDTIEWSGTRAVWEEIYGAKSYEVRLKRNGNTATTVKTENYFYDFAGDFTKRGEYTFQVRGISEYNDRAGEWSVESDSYYVDEEEVWYNSGNGNWMQNQSGWWYSYANGGYPTQSWKQIDGAWYYFNREGYMTTGWQYIDSQWYYMAPNGPRTTGWQYVGDRWYYMDRDGVMQTGWQYVDGRWYCMDQNGAMYVNTRTPDGYYVDASGARIN